MSSSESSSDVSSSRRSLLPETLPEDDLVHASVRLMKGFADETRLKILCLLREEEACVHDIVDALDVSQSGVSHQLRVLRDARLVAYRREGRHVYYRLADAHVRDLLDNALSHGAETT
jgi:ArsR family transcriptional regulator